MSLGYAVVQLDVTIVNTALNSIGASLGGGLSGMQWVVSSYTIAFAALILTAGAMGDRVGAKRMFMAGFAHLHGRVAHLRAGTRRGDPDRGEGRAGGGCGHPGPEFARPPQSRLCR